LTAPRLHKVRHHARRIAILGGSFDPVHMGHLAAARAATRRFRLDEVHFVLAGRPPHKARRELSPFPERYAMLALACAEHIHFLPSLAEAGEDSSGLHTAYSVDTVRRFRRHLEHPQDQLYFIVGADQFLELPTWRDYETLLSLCDFIVVSRPGIKMRPLGLVIPPELLGRPPAGSHAANGHSIALRKTTVHLLDNVLSYVSSSEVRRRRHRRQSIHGLVPARVEEYIVRQGLYL
jgi:nicotinate-nucleotide adenylyltransferase